MNTYSTSLAVWPKSGRHGWKRPHDHRRWEYVPVESDHRLSWERRLHGYRLEVHYVEPGRWFWGAGAWNEEYDNAPTKEAAMIAAESAAKRWWRER